MMQDRTCRQCKVVFKGGPRAYYCHVCRVERAKETDRDYARRKRAGLTRALGSTDTCERCKKPYTVVAGLQRFCPECQPIHAAEYDRNTSIEFYHEHKERINPPRNNKRRKRGNICEWCGNTFEPINGSTTCNDECRRQLRNRYSSTWTKKKRAEYAKPPEAINIPEIAHKIGKSRSTLQNWFNAGKLPEPDGYEKRGNPYWMPDTISHVLKTRTDPTSD